MSAPLVSVVMATYNRSRVLEYAIETVLWQTVQDWELIVVGDACTDDTADVVAAFGDPRIRFVNRAENCGEQSGPNNDGVALSKGTFIAYLNHDDLWMPIHLETAAETLQRGQYDLVYPLYLGVEADGTVQVCNVTPSTGYDTRMFVPASTWCMRREVAAIVGPWRHYKQSYAAPSQAWLRRAFRASCRIGNIERITSVRIPSSHRRDSYRELTASEHETWFRAMQRPGFLEDALTDAIIGLERWTRRATWGHFRRGALNMAHRPVKAMGIPWESLKKFARHGRKGGAIDRARAIRGLRPLGRDG